MNSNFKPEEIVKFERYNKKLKKNVETSFPIVGGRLRLFHEDLAKARVPEAGGISIDIIDRDREYALVKATVCIDGNSFTGIGMASKSRDSMIFPAIVEMAETRAIARALRFAGYGVEYTGAEEMQGVKNFDDDSHEPSSEVREPLDAPSTTEQSQDVNDGTTPSEAADRIINDVNDPQAPSLKRQVWNLAVMLHAGVQENYLAIAMKSFMSETAEKYGGSYDSVYGAILLNRDRFSDAFIKHVKAATPEIQAPGVMTPTDRGDETEFPPREEVPLAQEDQQKLNQLKKEAADNMKTEEPQPTVDKDKVAKANIYRAMPDGINVSALNGTLAHLIKENPDYEPGAIYAMVLDDIDGFMVMLKNWCKNNDTPSGLESPKEKPVLKMDIPTPDVQPDESTQNVPVPEGADPGLDKRSFRKAWVRLDLENFNKFIIQNASTFKADKAEYDAAVAKFERLKAKTEDTQNMVFPYVFSETEVKLDDSKSILRASEKELETLDQYAQSQPAIVVRVAESLKIDIHSASPTEAGLINDEVEKIMSEEG